VDFRRGSVYSEGAILLDGAFIVKFAAGCAPDDFPFIDVFAVDRETFMRRTLHLSVMLMLALLLGGCGTFQVGRDFDVGTFSARIERGVSTQAQVRGWLGEPTSMGVSMEADGTSFEQWSYYFAEGEMSDMSKAKLKLLQIKFDKSGKVNSYSWSASK